MERARAIWEELGLPPISPQPPWHGYTLGDWDEAYDIYARRAIEGAWEASGKETIERRRQGLIPETPAREIEATRSAETGQDQSGGKI
jgi:4-hydroxy-3-polyprenylbenzoate decarboxylase